ncbi:glycosyltransferase [Rubellicoccus peritrichatus]|uniref:Glycosyltransferase n=1 Tax=Rubellicoccus peritrichatus TaxID=3080537 RepID=A0AAQ3LC62_9BACT|nr:glycosyltransferase [Puniceicoccus sp. CR14]WOO40813.1 glycosyltransferase [Puniceicoccus sp. CR14]
MKPILSIITPVLNAEHFIVGCLENVASQNRKDIEHLVIDGGSTDNTRSFTLAFAETTEHTVRLIDGEGTSQSEALNLGINEAQSDILGILNADDFYEAGVIERVIQRFNKVKKKCSFLCANCNVLNQKDEVTSVNRPSKMKLSDLLAGRPYPWNPAAYFYHKLLHEKVGPYDNMDPLTMDIDFILRAVQHAHVVYFDETWGNFRYIPGAKTFQQGDAILDKVDSVRKRYLDSASMRVKSAARCKQLIDKLSHKAGRKFGRT